MSTDGEVLFDGFDYRRGGKPEHVVRVRHGDRIIEFRDRDRKMLDVYDAFERIFGPDWRNH